MWASFSCFDVIFLLVEPVEHCDHIVEEEGADCFAFLWFVVTLKLFVYFLTSSWCH